MLGLYSVADKSGQTRIGYLGLAEMLGQPSGTINNHIRSLIASGWIERWQPADGSGMDVRVFGLTIGPEGQELGAKAEAEKARARLKKLKSKAAKARKQGK